ncbi:MAG: TetR/AcrR family transcriptional regulator [Fusobacteriaceae bacterium]
MDKKTMKKNEIIKSSINIMHAKGYNGVGVKELTDAAGIPKGSFYNYFESKEDYGKEALYYYYSVINKDKFNILLDKDIDPLDRIRLFYGNMIDKISQDKSPKFGCFIGNLTQEISCGSSVIQEATKKIHQEIVMKIENCLKEGNMKNFKELGGFIASSWQGALLKTKAYNNCKPIENFYKILVEVLLK